MATHRDGLFHDIQTAKKRFVLGETREAQVEQVSRVNGRLEIPYIPDAPHELRADTRLGLVEALAVKLLPGVFERSTQVAEVAPR